MDCLSLLYMIISMSSQLSTRTQSFLIKVDKRLPLRAFSGNNFNSPSDIAKSQFTPGTFTSKEKYVYDLLSRLVKSPLLVSPE